MKERRELLLGRREVLMEYGLSLISAAFDLQLHNAI